jgi:glucose/arabinose dehydrogenase
MSRRRFARRAASPGALAAAAFLVTVAAVRNPARREEPGAEASLLAPDVGLELVVSGLGAITAITNAGDDRLFVTSQEGRLWIVSGGAVRPTPFLDIRDLVLDGGERGLLSTAFHPNYAENGFFFVYYTNGAGNIEIARFHRSADPNQADPASRIVLLTIPHPNFGNHNGGQLQFGPDGYLYAGTGDGGSGGDPPCNAQRDEVLLGKILRIDVDQNVNSPPFYGIPPDNPFAAPGGPRDEIWAKGVRILGASPSTGSPETSGSETSARARAKRSTSSRAGATEGRTTAGRSWRARCATARPHVRPARPPATRRSSCGRPTSTRTTKAAR